MTPYSRSSAVHTIPFRRYFSFFSLGFLLFGGYYSILILQSNVFSGLPSRLFTVSIRFYIVGLCIALFYSTKLTDQPSVGRIVMLSFSALYFLKIISELLYSFRIYHIPISDMLFYYTSFVFIPFFIISSMRLSARELEAICKGVISGCALMAVLTIVFYGQLLGSVGRISYAISRDSSNYISPLALSYVSSIGIALSIILFSPHKLFSRTNILVVFTGAVSTVPFYLGASRGSVIALVGSLFLYTIFQPGISRRLVAAMVAAVAIGSLWLASADYGSGAFTRVLEISEAVESGNSSSSRLLIWSDALREIALHPILGAGLESELAMFHPHNVVVEAFLATGVLGGILFGVFLLVTLVKSITIIRRHSEVAWISILFLQALIQNMFSGAIYGASWLAFGAALVLGFHKVSRVSVTTDMHPARRGTAFSRGRTSRSTTAI